MSHHTKPLVSVVTPFYNTEKYLSECIESVLRQSYREFEYILVNNCSTDRSLEIAQGYAKGDSRIRLYNNGTFLSQVQNYNHALEHISPESTYCKIVQADDWIFPECLAKMVELAEANRSVGIVGAYRLDDLKVNCDGLPYPSTVVKGRDVCRLLLLKGVYVFGTPNSILIRSNIVRERKPFYNQNSRYEDTEACFEILQDYDFGFVHQVLTFTRRENESISSTIRRFDPDYLLDRLIYVAKYGPIYLGKTEYQQALRSIERRYLRFLGAKMLSRNRKQLLEFHRNGLETIGYRLSFFKLVGYAMLGALGTLIVLKSTGRRLLRYS